MPYQLRLFRVTPAVEGVEAPFSHHERAPTGAAVLNRKIEEVVVEWTRPGILGLLNSTGKLGLSMAPTPLPATEPPKVAKKPPPRRDVKRKR